MPSSSVPFAEADAAIARYRAISSRLPAATFPERFGRADGLNSLAAGFDAFVLDAFGVLNVGETAIPGAPEFVAALQAAGRQVFVLTNGAKNDAAAALAKYRGFGFDLEAAQVVSSRDAAADALSAHPAGMVWGAASAGDSRIEDLPAQVIALGDDPEAYDRVDGILLLSSAEWNDDRHELMVASLSKHPRPVIVANPDLVAPREDRLSLEPGHYAHDIQDRTGIEPEFYGKPYRTVFEMVLARLGDVPHQRIAMVGDTLHTDILGGASMGWRTVLVTDHGLMRGRDVEADMALAGIVPDFIIPGP